ncbi:MAG: protein TolQ, partial [Candidatus Obscuribacterales bacterium]|nr:protein TolQ [Steroidobacteraceae bacterium]
MTGEMSIVQLVLSASIMVQLVLVLLLFASVASWAVIFAKRSELKKWRVSAERFEESFWSGGDLTAMYRAIEARREKTQGMESVFESGFREFARLRTQQG